MKEEKVLSEMLKNNFILFFGLMCSGKGTQIKHLSKYLRRRLKIKLKIIGTGRGFRLLAKLDSVLAQFVQKEMDAGAHIFNSLTYHMVWKLLEKVQEVILFIFDGVPRNPDQVEIIMELAKVYSCQRMIIFNFDGIPDEELIKRALGRGRTDDTEDTIKHRLDLDKENQRATISKLLEEAGHLGVEIRVIQINGNHNEEQVRQEMINRLAEL